MDQVRKVLTWLKEYHFWVLAVVVGMIAVGSWYSSASALQAEFAQNESAIKQQFSAVDGVASQPFIANPSINAKQTEQIATQREEVNRIWQQLYDRQSEGVLTWPQALARSFHEGVEDLKFEDEMTRNMRDEYLNYIDRHFPELPKKIGAREVSASDSSGGMMRGTGRSFRSEGGGGYRTGGYGEGGGYSATGELEDEGDYIVEWLDQARVRDELYFGQRPSSLEIWVTQENLWIYHTLLNVIAETNAAKGADRISNAAVRRIYELQVGQDAAQAETTMASGNRIWMPPSAGPAMDGMMMGGEAGGYPSPEGGTGMPFGQSEFSGGGYGGYGEMGRMEGGGGEDERIALLSGRYLDATGQPIQVSSPTPTPGEFGREYKRLPIRMALEMDIRWLQRLVTECANQPLQVEVKEIRINPTDGTSMGGSYGRSEGGFRGSGGGASPFRTDNTGEIKTFKANPHIGTVVIQGTIYIFNPPDMDAIAGSDPGSIALTQ